MISYSVGHTMAMQLARNAGIAYMSNFTHLNLTQRGDAIQIARQALEMAYSMNAFSDHFLTDMFASGHIRTPRKLILQTCSNLDSGGLVAQWMHDEDNRNGLWINNLRGDIWNTSGDDNYWDAANAQNRLFIQQAVQISRNEVYAAFNGANDSFGALQIVPIQNTVDPFILNNTCSLFVRDPSLNGNILIRNPVTQLRSPLALAILNNQPTTNLSSNCNYVSFPSSLCPNALLQKISQNVQNFIIFWEDLPGSLQWNQNNQAWCTTEAPEPNSSSLLFPGIIAITLSVLVTVL